MSNNVDVVLWEDLSEAQGRLHKALEALQSVQRAIADDRVSQPTRQNSNHLTRLNVLADLLYTEVCQLIEEIPLTTKARV
jgi:hypothetical protein